MLGLGRETLSVRQFVRYTSRRGSIFVTWSYSETLRPGLTLLSCLLLSACFGTGCATVFGGGGKETVEIRSEPTGATVDVDGRKRGETPLRLKLNTSDSHVVLVERECHEYKTVTLGRKAEVGWMILDGLFAIPTLGTTVAVDFVTKSYFTFEQHVLRLQLPRKQGCAAGK
jgi:hypothetical protein